QVLDEVYDLFIELGASEELLEFPVFYCNAKQGTCRRSPDGEEEPLVPLLDAILDSVPAPRYEPGLPLQFQVSTLDYDDYVGRLAIGRVFNGELRAGKPVVRCGDDEEPRPARVTGLRGYDGLARVAVEVARQGDIVAVVGLEEIAIGDTLCAPEDPRPLPPIRVDEPTITMTFGI
ncbi:MAG: translational GTPase TypA, partial [bacterium]|nr:translational GTPase TypA [bacterium]